MQKQNYDSNHLLPRTSRHPILRKKFIKLKLKLSCLLPNLFIKQKQIPILVTHLRIKSKSSTKASKNWLRLIKLYQLSKFYSKKTPHILYQLNPIVLYPIIHGKQQYFYYDMLLDIKEICTIPYCLTAQHPPNEELFHLTTHGCLINYFLFFTLIKIILQKSTNVQRSSLPVLKFIVTQYACACKYVMRALETLQILQCGKMRQRNQRAQTRIVFFFTTICCKQQIITTKLISTKKQILLKYCKCQIVQKIYQFLKHCKF
eukprot:TRINITY_DN5285_c0_g1_i6.p2 TRINITY_DN5285_c0_g1~~TRINITY_DN5285_c0_g1_i6.p2  ORF type:complete len:260 (-),score=-22.45 TRINITY_DN5285_c0_g1_i6:430-1209(-)